MLLIDRDQFNQILTDFPKLFVTVGILLQVKTKVPTVFAKLSVYRPHLVANIAVSIDQPKMINANNQ